MCRVFRLLVCDILKKRYKNQREKDREVNIEKKKIRDELARAERQKDEVDRKLEKMSIRSSCLGIDRNGRCAGVMMLIIWLLRCCCCCWWR
jgi:predicted nuclease with TOPRIM domain